MLIVSPRVTSARATDFRSIASILAGPRLAGKTGQDLAVALWRLIVDRSDGLYHYCPALERLTGHFVYDPVKLFNVFGWSTCGVTANTLAVLYQDAGFQAARLPRLKGHEATEVYYDGGWHLLDGDLQAYHRRHPPEQHVIAGYHECLADPTLISRQQNPSDPYYLPDRPPEAMAELYRVEPHTDPAFADHSHTMDFVLRPGEVLERSVEPSGRWIWFDNYGEFRQRFGGEWCPDGPRERFKPHRRYGSGQWTYHPRLTADSLDFEAGVFEARNARPAARGVEPAAAGPSACAFEFSSPWVFAGVPGPDGAGASDGCLLRARLVQASAGDGPRIILTVDPDLPACTVWRSPGAGTHEIALDLTEQVANAYRYLLRFELGEGGPGSCVLEDLRVTSSVMVAPATLGRLAEGDNQWTVAFGDDCGLPTRRLLIETDFGSEADVRAKAHRLVNVRFLPGTDDRILPADPTWDYAVVYRLDAPPHGRVQRVFVHTAIRGRAQDDADAGRAVAEWAPAEDGPWRTIYDEPVRDVPHRWHFSAEGQAVLPEPRERVFVRLSGKAGMRTGRIRVHYLDDRLDHSAPPLTVTHEWARPDGSIGRHVRRIDAPRGPQTYTIPCGPDPELRRVILAADSLGR